LGRAWLALVGGLASGGGAVVEVGDDWDIGDRGGWIVWDRWDGGDSRSIVGGGCQTGMVGSGVETTGGRDQLPGRFHAQEHFAPGFVVIAGSREDLGDALRGGAVV
jgi:hypothetical protein